MKKQYIDWISQAFDVIGGWVQDKKITRDEVTRLFMRHKLLKCRQAMSNEKFREFARRWLERSEKEAWA